MLPLTKEELKLHRDSKKVLHFCKKKILQKLAKSKNYQKVRDYCHYTGKCKYRGAAHSICYSNFKTLDQIPVVFHNGSNCDYHVIIEKLANTFDCTFECLGENTKIIFHFKRNRSYKN